MKKKALFAVLLTATFGLSACGVSSQESSDALSSINSSESSSNAASPSSHAGNPSSYDVTSQGETSFSITYDLDGGTNDPSNPSSYGPGTTLTFASPKKTGYEFVGWFDANGTQIFGIEAGTAGNLTLFARWRAILNTLTVTSEDASKGTVAVTSGSGYSDESITVVATPKFGYKFDAWYHEQTKVSTESTYTFAMPTSDYSLLGRFLADEDAAAKYGMTPKVSSDGKTLTYGLYPQKNVRDATLISSLNALTSPSSNGWYFYDQAYYAKTIAAPYGKSYKFDNGTQIVEGTTYWFKCEPIAWNVLSKSDGEYFVLSSLLLDVSCYYHLQEVRETEPYWTLPNNYEHSDIRAWLNGDFLDSAFALDRSYILTTEVDNSPETTHSEYNTYCCENTQDKVFLPSYQDYINADYGFSTSDGSSNTRYAKTTDWARAKGAFSDTKNAYANQGSYWTRSPRRLNNNFYNSWAVSSMGFLGFDNVECASDCVRPALNLKIS